MFHPPYLLKALLKELGCCFLITLAGCFLGSVGEPMSWRAFVIAFLILWFMWSVITFGNERRG